MATRIPVTLANGTTVYYDSSGVAYTKATGGSVVSNSTISSSTAPSPHSSNTTPTSASSASPSSSSNVITDPATGQKYQWNGTTYVPYTGGSSTTATSSNTQIPVGSYNGVALYKNEQGQYYTTNAQGGGTTFGGGLPAGAVLNSTTSPTTQTPAPNPGVTDADFNANALALGLSQEQINQLDPTQKALIASVGEIARNTYSNGSGITLKDAINYAKQDPNILAKYGDALKLDTQSLMNAAVDLQNSANTDTITQQQQFEDDRKALAERHATAGTAYSGFRGQAQQQLGTQEQGIVESSRNTIKKGLNDATQAFEAKYGSAASAANPISVNMNDPYANSNYTISGLYSPSGGALNTLTGKTHGGITGSQPIAQDNDVLNKAANVYQLGQLPTM